MQGSDIRNVRRVPPPFLKEDGIETLNHNLDTYLLCRPIARPSQAAQPAAKTDK
jgi:hypothetical protein